MDNVLKNGKNVINTLYILLFHSVIFLKLQNRKIRINFNPQCYDIIRCPVFLGSLHKLEGRGQIVIGPWHGTEHKLALLIHVLCSLCQTPCVGLRGRTLSPKCARCSFSPAPTHFSFVKKAKHSQRRFSRYI